MPPDTDFPRDLRILERSYELIRELGQGGMAAVYLARRRDTGTLVAIKAIRARYVDDPELLQRFAREARTVAGLDHPNIVRTEAIEQIGDRAIAIIMQHIPGGTVRERLGVHGAFGTEHAESVLRDVAHALGYAHRLGIVHRDVKPENVFLDERTGRALLSDFGIARRIEGDVPITLLGAALGTPQYMSPEQIEGWTVDGRSDIYSLGVLGWELLTGRRPWAGENLYGVIYKQKHEELPPIMSLRPRVPTNLLFAIEGALVKDRKRRWQSIDDFLGQLTYNPEPVLAQPSPVGATHADDEPTVRFRSTSKPTAAPRDMMPREPTSEAVDDTAASRGFATANDEIRPHEPNRKATRAATFKRARARPWRIARGLALLVLLGIAGTSLYVLSGVRLGDALRGNGSDAVSSSGGSIALDTTRGGISTTATVRPVDPADSLRRTGSASPSSPPRAADTVRSARSGKSAPPEGVTVRSDVTRRDSLSTAAPSPRCRIASMADQRACLLAYISLNDASLQLVYDSLVAEHRSIARVGRGAPDPPAVTRLRAEQRAWIVARDRECRRRRAPGSVPFWAEPLSECFAEMSAARADELAEARRRVRGQ